MDFNALGDFQLVATHGGFGKASRASGRSKATLSRRVAELEEALGLRLIERGAQRLALTEAGQLLLQRTQGPMHEVAEAVAAARDSLATPRGRLAGGRTAAVFAGGAGRVLPRASWRATRAVESTRGRGPARRIR